MEHCKKTMFFWSSFPNLIFVFKSFWASKTRCLLLSNLDALDCRCLLRLRDVERSEQHFPLYLWGNQRSSPSLEKQPCSKLRSDHAKKLKQGNHQDLLMKFCRDKKGPCIFSPVRRLSFKRNTSKNKMILDLQNQTKLCLFF